MSKEYVCTPCYNIITGKHRICGIVSVGEGSLTHELLREQKHRYELWHEARSAQDGGLWGL